MHVGTYPRLLIISNNFFKYSGELFTSPLPIPRATAPLGFYFINPSPPPPHPQPNVVHDKRSMKGHKFHQKKHFDTLSGLL